MTAEIYLTPEQEEKFFTIYHKRNLVCTNQELVQDLFNEALTANYLLYGKGTGHSEPSYELVTIEYPAFDDGVTDEEKKEIMQEIWESEERERSESIKL